MKMTKISTEEAKKIMLEATIYFAKFCKENGLKMWLHGGTLLGAIRHKGYIPWDDDIDLAMPREDYEKLLKMTDKLDPGYTLFEHRLNKRYKYPFAKLSVNDTLCVEFHNPKSCGVRLGIYLDIFPIDYVGNTEEDAKAFCEETSEMVFYSWRFLRQKLEGGFVGRTIKTLKRAIRYNRFAGNRFLARFDAKLRSYKEPTAYCAVPAWINAPKTIMKREEYDGGEVVSFEGHEFLAYQGYIHWLESVYGDYMTLPPVEKREIHGCDFYIKQK